MVYYLDMPFEKEEDIPDFGSIAMYFVGLPQLGYHEYNNKKFRKYVLDSIDISKLNLINNAIDGSQAETLDTGDKYILCENQWIKQPAASSGGSGDVANLIGLKLTSVQEVLNPDNTVTAHFYFTGGENAITKYAEAGKILLGEDEEELGESL